MTHNNELEFLIIAMEKSFHQFKTMNKRVHTIMCLQCSYKTSFKISQKHQLNKVNYQRTQSCAYNLLVSIS